MFIFGRCHHSYAVGTPVKYEHDSFKGSELHLISKIEIVPKREINDEQSFSHPHPSSVPSW